MDDGFAYSVPDGIDVEVGAIVRVPLGGRRVRGYVVASEREPREGLKPILGRSGTLPVFDASLLGVARWAALHYVAPLAAVLRKTAPPNLPRGKTRSTWVGERRRTPHMWLGDEWMSGIGDEVEHTSESGGSVLIVVPSIVEAERSAAMFGDRATVAHSDLDHATVTKAWVRAATVPGTILVGTREVALWPVASPALAVIADEARRGHKDKATPTIHTREVMRRRAAAQKFALTLTGLVPSLEAITMAPEATSGRGRLWPQVEIVDRSEELATGGRLGDRARQAMRAVRADGGDIFLLANRRAPALRCVACKRVRRCPACGANPGGGGTCVRCGHSMDRCEQCGGGRFEALGANVDSLTAEAKRVVGGAGVRVGTERDLLDLPQVRLAVIVDADGLLMAPHYRAGEEALRLMARVAAKTAGPSARTIVQTSDPQNPAIVALRRADPLGFLAHEAEARAAAGFPPSGELLALEVSGNVEPVDASLREAVADRAQVLGPAAVRDRRRWLVQGSGLASVKATLRGRVQDWRDAGARVRVDVDPIDL